MVKVKNMPTIDDVARHAGVSTATVSRCLNLPERVKEKTRARVENSVKILGYTPNFGGKALASNRTNTIGAVIPTMSNAIFAQAMQSLQEELSEHSITLFIATSQYEAEREEKQIRSLLSRGVDGLVLIGDERSSEIYDLIDQRAIPHVILWTSHTKKDRLIIGFDNFEAAKRLTEKVIDYGHQNIAMLAGIVKGNGRANDRVNGVKSALKNAGFPLKNEYLREAHYSLDDSKEKAEKLLALPNRPTAIICGNDVLAAGVILTANKLNIKVPQDVAVVGFDDIDLAQTLDPALTTLRVPHRRMGQAAANALIYWIDNKSKPENVLFDVDIIERESLKTLD